MKKVQFLRTNTSGKQPTSAQLLYGELAINYKNGAEKIFLKNDTNEIVSFSTSEQNDAKYALKTSIPTKVSQLTNDSGFYTSA